MFFYLPGTKEWLIVIDTIFDRPQLLWSIFSLYKYKLFGEIEYV